MRTFKLVLVLIVSTFYYSQSQTELNGFYCNKFGQCVNFDDGKMDWYRSTYAYEFEKQEHYTYKYSNKQVVYKYKDIELNYEGDQVTSFNNRGRLYKRMYTIRDILNVKRLKVEDNYNRINKKQTMTLVEFNDLLDDDSYLKHSNVVVPVFTIDELVINLYKSRK